MVLLVLHTTMNFRDWLFAEENVEGGLRQMDYAVIGMPRSPDKWSKYVGTYVLNGRRFTVRLAVSKEEGKDHMAYIDELDSDGEASRGSFATVARNLADELCKLGVTSIDYTPAAGNFGRGGRQIGGDDPQKGREVRRKLFGMIQRAVEANPPESCKALGVGHPAIPSYWKGKPLDYLNMMGINPMDRDQAKKVSTGAPTTPQPAPQVQKPATPPQKAKSVLDLFKDPNDPMADLFRR